MCRLINLSISPNKFVTYLISPFLLIHLKTIDLTKYSQKHTIERNSPDINTNKVYKFCDLAIRFVIDWGRGGGEEGVEINGDGKIHKTKAEKKRFDITCLLLGHPFIKMIIAGLLITLNLQHTSRVYKNHSLPTGYTNLTWELRLALSINLKVEPTAMISSMLIQTQTHVNMKSCNFFQKTLTSICLLK